MDHLMAESPTPPQGLRTVLAQVVGGRNIQRAPSGEEHVPRVFPEGVAKGSRFTLGVWG